MLRPFVNIKIFGNFLPLKILSNCSETHSIPFELMPKTIRSIFDFNNSSNFSNLKILIPSGIFILSPG